MTKPKTKTKDKTKTASKATAQSIRAKPSKKAKASKVAEAATASAPVENSRPAAAEIDISDQNLDAGVVEFAGVIEFTDEEVAKAAETGDSNEREESGSDEDDDEDEVTARDTELDARVLDSLDGSGAELGDLADELHVSEAEIRGSVRRLEEAGQVVATKDLEGGGTYVNLPAEEDDKKIHAVKAAGGSNGSGAHGANGKSNGVTNDRQRVAAAGLKGAPAGNDESDEDDEDERPTRNLKCILTASEKREKAEAVANNFKAIEELEAERERLADDLKSVKGKIDGLNLDNRRAMRANREGYEYRDVICIEQSNLASATIDTVRIDTLEVIESRAMTSSERQGKLFDEARA
jgi:hypothetical protein